MDTDKGGAGSSDASAAAATLAQLQQDMALLAFPDPVRCGVPAYERLFHEDRWLELRQLFVTDFGRAMGVPRLSGLTVALQAGLCALKLPDCKLTYVQTTQRPHLFNISTLNRCVVLPNASLHRHPSKTPPATYGPPRKDRVPPGACPACHPLLAPIADRLPACRRTKSRLICRMSRTPMEGANHPMVLPNGSVYGVQALTTMAQAHGGEVTCPRTGAKARLEHLRKAFVL